MTTAKPLTDETDNHTGVLEALATFFHAFGDLDRDQVQACFTEDVTVFGPFGGKRQVGFWLDIFDTWRATRPGPPYLNLQPAELQVQMFRDVAVASFHLEDNPKILSRRTLVLTRMADEWKIVHVHASNLPRDMPSGNDRAAARSCV